MQAASRLITICGFSADYQRLELQKNVYKKLHKSEKK